MRIEQRAPAKSRDFSIVLVTVPNLKTARALAEAMLSQHLAACVNIIPRIESHYWWEGKIDRSAELLLLIKTRRSRLPGLERCIAKLHPYDTPEFLVLPLTSGSARYLNWLRDSVA